MISTTRCMRGSSALVSATIRGHGRLHVWPIPPSLVHPINRPKSTGNGDGREKPMFLHVGPSGDCWTGTSIFAAKHLQPDYVKSVPLPDPSYLCVETLIQVLEEDNNLAQAIYDDGALSDELLERVRAAMKEQEEF